MKNSKSTKMIIILVIAVMVSISYFIFPSISDAELEQKIFVTHSGAIVKTTGEILDPIYSVQTVDFDPDKFLREFNYGRVSMLEDGRKLREFTIIAEDDKTMEISPGIFYMYGHLMVQFQVLQLEPLKET